MKIAGTVLRWLYGLFYTYIGGSWTLHLLMGWPWITPPEPPRAKALTAAFTASGLVDPMIAGTCLVGGLLLLVRRTAPLGIAVLAPLVTGIFLFHLLLSGGWAWGAAHFAILIVLAWLHRSAFKPLWSYQAVDRAEWRGCLLRIRASHEGPIDRSGLRAAGSLGDTEGAGPPGGPAPGALGVGQAMGFKTPQAAKLEQQ